MIILTIIKLVLIICSSVLKLIKKTHIMIILDSLTKS